MMTVKNSPATGWNPLLDHYREYFGACRMEILQRRIGGSKYSWSIPTEEALDVIAEHAGKCQGVVEMAAGTGYWCRMLRDHGVDIIAYDLNPVPSELNRSHHMNESWTEVLQGDPTCVLQHHDRVLLMCWPPSNAPVASQTLSLYRGDKLIYIGQPDGADGSCGDAAFYQLLKQDWHLEQIVSLPRWSDRRDDMRVYSRISQCN